MRTLITLVIACLFLQSCTKSNEEIEKEEIQLFANNNSNQIKGYKYLVILPGLGCHGCIQEAEVFMQNHINNQQILFVLTKIESLKILQQKIGVKVNEHENILVDQDQNFNISTANTIYPCIARMQDGIVKSYGFQSPANSEAFSNLKNELDAK